MQAQLSAMKKPTPASQPPLSAEKMRGLNNTKAFHPSMETRSYAQKLREYNHKPHTAKKAGNKLLPKAVL